MKNYFSTKSSYLFILLLLVLSQSCSQDTLETRFEEVAEEATGVLGLSVLHIESGESISLNGDKKFPMQSVYKVPIAMVMLHEIDAGKFSLEDTIRVDTNEYIPKAGHSPLRDNFPDGAKVTIKELLEYNVSKSDGTACDVLLRLLGGTEQVQKSIHGLGIKQIAIATTEMIQVANDTIQYQNWVKPPAMNKLLQILLQGNYLSDKSKALLLDYMLVSNKWFDKRIKGQLPSGVEVAHKTGTSRTYDGLTRATNDAGIINLPDGSHLAISVFVMDSYDDQQKRETIIATVAKLAYDHWIKDSKN